jgi:DNA ligase (NAD+)
VWVLAKDWLAGRLAGRRVVLTGKLTLVTRAVAEELVGRHGGTVQRSVSRRTDLVVVGSRPGSKLDRARELGIETLDDGSFLELIGMRPPS